MSYETAIAVILSTSIIGVLWLATNMGNKLTIEQIILFIFATALIWGSLVEATNIAEANAPNSQIIDTIEKIQVFSLYLLYLEIAYAGITITVAALRFMKSAGTDKNPQPFTNTR